MSKVAQGFHINEEKHYLFYDEKDFVIYENQSYFNKNTIRIGVIKGFEGNERVQQISDKEYILIKVIYRIANYFGDKSGRHIRSKSYIYDGTNFYNDHGNLVKRVPNEIRNAFYEFNTK